VSIAIEICRGKISAYRLVTQVSRDSVVGIATCYGLDSPEIESRWGARFSSPVETGPEAHAASYSMGTGSYLGLKRPGRRVDHPPRLAQSLKQRVELYTYSPSGAQWPEILSLLTGFSD